METTDVIGVVIAFGVAFTLISGSGLGAAVFDEQAPETTLDTYSETVEENKEPSFSVVGALGDLPLIGIIIDFGDIVSTFVGTVAFLPIYLMRLGFPNYFAVPVGTIAQLIATIGIFQVITGREYR